MEERVIRKKALEYHSKFPPGKIGVSLKKSLNKQLDLALAYTPGVAYPSLEISKNQKKVWDYTIKSNSVAIVSDGTAVLSLGNIGAHASIPVMEGKAALFKRFANVDAFPICLNIKKNGRTDVNKLVEAVKQLEPVFGGINLEDIAAPECFDVENKLKEEVDFPVFHDDQHGTAIITLAGLFNALELTDKKISEIKVVVNGAGAAGIACSNFYIRAGVKKKNLILCDSKGVISKGRKNLNKYKKEFISNTGDSTLKEAMKGADVFLGLSAPNIVSQSMVRSMADKSIVFALANPIPEIRYKDAVKAGAFVVSSGRSDVPNQINNVLGFPGIFRGALDARAMHINYEMKLAASKALAELAKESFPKKVRNYLSRAYPFQRNLFVKKEPFSNHYVIPKPLDPRVVPRVAEAVIEAAYKTKVAHNGDIKHAKERTRKRLNQI